MRHLFVAATLVVVLSFSGLPSQFEKIALAAKARVGVAAQLLESGETADLHGDEHFPMHSVYKLPISMAVLQRVDRGELNLDQQELSFVIFPLSMIAAPVVEDSV